MKYVKLLVLALVLSGCWLNSQLIVDVHQYYGRHSLVFVVWVVHVQPQSITYDQRIATLSLDHGLQYSRQESTDQRP